MKKLKLRTEHNFKKKYGQNFLRSKRYAISLTKELGISEGDTVVEIGPGDGMLTDELLKTGAKVVCIEVDYSLLPNLIKRFSSNPNFKLIHDDFLNVDLAKVLNEGEIYFAGSLPYNISKEIIQKIVSFHFEQENFVVNKMSFIVQEEVAQNYVAKAPKANLLSTTTSVFSKVKKHESIPASQFFPKPKVNGAIISFIPKDIVKDETILHTIKVGYSSIRKTLRNNLVSSRIWSQEQVDQAMRISGLSKTSRPSEIDFEKWELLHESLNSDTA